MNYENIPHVNIRADVAERYYARLIQGLTDEQARAFLDQYGGTISMPCGAFVDVNDLTEQRCPNSGNCAAGHKECWALKRQ